MWDFTTQSFITLLSELLSKKYEFLTFYGFTQNKDNNKRKIILRHDVDKKIDNALKVAKIEHEMGIRSSFYFRYIKSIFNKRKIEEISELGHEIGYHYEVLSKTQGNMKKGIELFEKELNEFRRITDIKTICMHGSPLSKWDNRKLWEEYDYHDFGIIGEPYFDIDFNEVLYMTDTGRRWDGSSVNVRDKADQNIEYRRQKIEEKKFKNNNITNLKNSFHSTFDIIRAAKEGKLPDKLMINIHPQRWNSHFIPWVWELISQNGKNAVKKFLVIRNNRRKSRKD